jgi:broad specificity phosphatase PhoE
VQLLLIRHAEPQRVQSEVGIADPTLTDKGRQQASRLAKWLQSEHLDHIVTSPLRRARETAAPLAEQFGFEPEVIKQLAEFDAEASSYIPMEELRATRDPRIAALTEGRWEELGSLVRPETFRGDVVTVLDRSRRPIRGSGSPSSATARSSTSISGMSSGRRGCSGSSRATRRFPGCSSREPGSDRSNR